MLELEARGIMALAWERKCSYSQLLFQDQGLSSMCWLRGYLLAVITAFYPLASCFVLHVDTVFSAGCGPAGESMQLCPYAHVLLCGF